jgi:membrane protease YdiL (CAAX protease family)
VYEELVFRSVILGLALRRSSPAVALAGTSVLFGFWHVLPTLRDHGANDLTAGQPRHHAVAVAVAVTTLAGVGFGSQRLRTGSVVTPIITHAVGNAVMFATAAFIGRHERRARAAARLAATGGGAAVAAGSGAGGADPAAPDTAP